MNSYNKYFSVIMTMLFISLISLSSCKKDNDDDMMMTGPDPDAVYAQEDQTARPAINTVFNTTEGTKNSFNVTPPSEQAAAFNSMFISRLNALNAGYTTNALGLDDMAFMGLLSTDVLNVSTTGTTTFFDGTNVLTGRNLEDDVIDVELLLIFGGPTGTDNPGLTSDNVDANDLSYSASFPYLANPH
jgi:hypothetical protein